MTLTTIPDAERIAYDWLSTHPDVVAVGTRLVGRTPKDTGAPWVRVTLLDASDLARHEHLISSLLQLDVYAGSQEIVWQHARAIRAALNQLEDTIQDGVTINRVDFAGMMRRPDDDFTPARERVILTVELVGHR